MKTFEYKYVIIDSNTWNVVRWEQLENDLNREMTVKQKGSFTVYDKEGSFKTILKQMKSSKSQSGGFKNRTGSIRFKTNSPKPVRVIDTDRKHSTHGVYPKHDFGNDRDDLQKRRSVMNKDQAFSKIVSFEESDQPNPLLLNLDTDLMKQKSTKILSQNADNQHYKFVESLDSQSSDEEDPNKSINLVRNIKDLEKRVLSYQDITAIDNTNDKLDKLKETYLSTSKTIIGDDYFEDIRENFEEENEMDITDQEVVIMVAIKLPYSAIKNDQGEYILHKTTSLLYSRLYDRNPDKKLEEWWIGWASLFPESEKEKQDLIKLYREKNCIPVFIEQNIIGEYFNFYEKQVVPLFHNFKTHFEHKESYDQFDDWNCYRNVNQIFAASIADFITKEVTPLGKNSLVWVNNQHLLLTPRFLRESIDDVSIGLFLHCPFPASEIFKLIPYRKSLLQSLLN